jgi:hypothetical protein
MFWRPLIKPLRTSRLLLAVPGRNLISEEASWSGLIAAKRQYAGCLLRLLSLHTTSPFNRNFPRFAFDDPLPLGSRLSFSFLGVWVFDLCLHCRGLSFKGRLDLGFRLRDSWFGRPDGRLCRSRQNYPGGSRRLQTCARLRGLVKEPVFVSITPPPKPTARIANVVVTPFKKTRVLEAMAVLQKHMTSERTAGEISFAFIKI